MCSGNCYLSLLLLGRFRTWGNLHVLLYARGARQYMREQHPTLEQHKKKQKTDVSKTMVAKQFVFLSVLFFCFVYLVVVVLLLVLVLELERNSIIKLRRKL